VSSGPPRRSTGFFDQFRYMRWWQLVLVVLPLSLIGIGGIVGGILGALAALGNTYVARSRLSVTTKVLVMLGVLFAAYFVWLVMALAVSSAMRGSTV
jgi:hypothetical protein